MDVPIVLTSSSVSIGDECDFRPCLNMVEDDQGSEPDGISHKLGTIFEEALASTLEAQRHQATIMAEQERFNPIDSASRVSVPVMDFTIDPPAWMGHAPAARDQFSWIRAHSGSSFVLPLENKAPQQDKFLKWAPFPPGTGRIAVQEAFDPLPEERWQCLLLGAAPTLNSASYVTQDHRRLMILQVQDEEELDQLTLTTGEERSPSPSPKSAQRLAGGSQPSSPSSQGPSLDALVGAAARKRHRGQSPGQLADHLGVLLPSTGDCNATSKLLSRFMEMRAVKKPKVADSASSAGHAGQGANIGGSFDTSQKQLPDVSTRQSPEVEETRIPATAPDAIFPPEKSAFVISLSLPRSVLRNIEASWPPDHLLDRDYTLYDTVAWSPGSAQRKEVPSPLSFDADIALTPAVGIIVTTLLKAKQKPLPGSQALPQLRKRVLQVSRKFETLFVLVSESNTSGEWMGRRSTSDIAAYADFVGFTVALRSGVTTCFVSGADATLAKWILALMCQYSPGSLGLSRFLNASESTWEVFFRRAGMNVFAAQVLAGTLFEQAGNEGLMRFVAMSLQERVSAYSQLLGGKKAILSASEILDGAWA